jgi:hypothetical protein
MNPKQAKHSRSGPGTGAMVLRLYISKNAPNSVLAAANIGAICKEYLVDSIRLEIIDVLEYPLRALADGILVTPSLTKVSPMPAAKMVGNLNDKNSVLLALGIKPNLQ